MLRSRRELGGGDFALALARGLRQLRQIEKVADAPFDAVVPTNRVRHTEAVHQLVAQLGRDADDLAVVFDGGGGSGGRFGLRSVFVTHCEKLHLSGLTIARSNILRYSIVMLIVYHNSVPMSTKKVLGKERFYTDVRCLDLFLFGLGESITRILISCCFFIDRQ